MNWAHGGLKKHGLPDAFASAAILKSTKYAEANMDKSEYFEHVILHELAHGYHINFLKGGINNPDVKKAWLNASGC